MIKSVTLLVAGAAVVAVLVAPRRALATRVLNQYDVDSLVYLSDAIIHADVVSSRLVQTRDGDCRVDDVKVRKCVKGDIRPGTTTRLARLDEFRHAPGILGVATSREPVGPADEVYVFLVRKGKAGYAKYALTDAEWTVVESGCRLLSGDRVYSFWQDLRRMGGAGFVAMTNDNFPGAPVLTRKQFEDQLRGAIQWVGTLSPMLDERTPADPSRAGEYMRLLRAREDVRRRERTRSDRIGSLLAVKVGQTATPFELLSVRGEASFDVRTVLDNGLKSASGREYLLRRVGNTNEEMSVRLQAAELLAGAGWNYQQELATSRPATMPAGPASASLAAGDAHADGFATRLARLTVKNSGTPLVEPLTRALGDCAYPDKFTPPPILSADLRSAVEVLSGGVARANGTVDQFRIAAALMRLSSRDTVGRALPGAGPLLTLIEPDHDFVAGVPRRTLRLTCRFRNQIPADEPPVRLLLVMRSATSRVETEVAVDSKITGLRDSFGSAWKFEVKVPEAISPGRYHAFFRARGQKQCFGDGIGFDVQLPSDK